MGQVALEAGEGRIERTLAEDAVEDWLNHPHVLDRLDADGAIVLHGHPLGAAAEAPSPVLRASLAGLQSGHRPHRHALKLFEVEVQRDGERHVEVLLGRGVGLGFFGYHSWLVAACLGDRTPEVLGIHEGVLFMRWEAGEGQPEDVEEEELDEIAAYVAARARRLDLGAGRDPAPDAREAAPAARRVARLLALPLGRRGILAEPRLLEAIDRATAPGRHSVVDGRMGPSEWVRSGHGGLLKVDFEEHGFGATDAAGDLAGAVIGFRLEPDEERRLVEAYVRLTGDSDSLAARLLVHKLGAGLDALDALRLDPATAPGRVAFARELAIRETLLTRAVNGYLGGRHLADLDGEPGGDLWVLGLEDVLETDRGGFAAVSPASASALRALAARGDRVLLTTGCSLGEVRERCHAFALVGGIAELGSVVWDEAQQRVTAVVAPRELWALARLREAVLEETDALVDPRHRYSLHLFRHGEAGRRGVDAEEVSALIRRHGLDGLEVVETARRTLVRAAGADEGAAFWHLRSLLPGAPSSSPLHVVASAPTSLGLLETAQTRAAPASASPEVRAVADVYHIRIASAPHQAGLLEAVRRGAGGRRVPAPELGRADAALVRLLGLQDLGRAARLAFLARSASLGACEL